MNELPLKEKSINELFWGGNGITYEIPIYQRNYAWEKDEIAALIQDVYDAYDSKTPKPVYYIGTLVTYNKGEQIYEVIDGQQRLTTIRIILSVLLKEKPTNKLTYRARQKSNDTIINLPEFKGVEEKDPGIVKGYEFAKNAVDEKIPVNPIKRNGFINYFKNNVHIIHYEVPKDIDLNHYFEVMNSRGEQLEKHEIIKANLMSGLPDYQNILSQIWNACNEMSVYVQRNFLEQETKLYGSVFNEFIPSTSDLFWKLIDQKLEEIKIKAAQKPQKEEDQYKNVKHFKISDIIDPKKKIYQRLEEETEKKDSFQPIIDFPNFLLTVLKITRMDEPDFDPESFSLDDKELINEFNHVNTNDPIFVKKYVYNLLKARFFLDNYIVHHSKEEDTYESNPWKLQRWTKDSSKEAPENLRGTDQDNLVHLLSMFEVSFTAKQRKNYLFYCLYYLMNQNKIVYEEYEKFVETLANRYFFDVYMVHDKLNDINTPTPGSFDKTILLNHKFNDSPISKPDKKVFIEIYGDGTKVSPGVPLFVFNFMDYKLWKKYNKEAKGLKKGVAEDDKKRAQFFDELKCNDFGLDFFNHFYFSRTRRSLEHYYPQATATGENGALTQEQINCFGNYAMIGSEANSSGSNWDPLTKISHYIKDNSGKINKISVASPKFLIMMNMCDQRQRWSYEDIKEHQEVMMSLLLKQDGN